MKKQVIFILIFVSLHLFKIYPASSNLTGDMVVYPGENLIYRAGNVGEEQWVIWNITNGTFWNGTTSWSEKGPVLGSVKWNDVAETGRITFRLMNNPTVNGYLDAEILSVANSQVDSIKIGNFKISSDTVFIPKGESGTVLCSAYMVFPATKGVSNRQVTTFRWEFPASLGGDTIIQSQYGAVVGYNSNDGDGEKIVVRPASTTKTSSIISYGAPRIYTIKRIDGLVENRDISVNESFEGENLIFRNVNIFSGVYVPIHGSGSVRLLPQFHAYYGSNVHISAGGNLSRTTDAEPAMKTPAAVSVPFEERETGFSQNYPNPCSGNTSIDFCLPEEVREAFLCVVSPTGQQVRRVALGERGTHVLNLDVSVLSPGLYLYYVVADGKMLGTRRMVVADR